MEQKKIDRKIFWKFIIIMIICGIVGAAFGAGLVSLEGNLALAYDAFFAGLQHYSVHLLAICSVLFLGAAFIIYLRARSDAAKLDPEDDEAYVSANLRLDISLQLCNILQILAFTLFAISASTGILDAGPSFLVSVLIFIVPTFLMIALQQACVKVVKTLNPEKKGNVLDAKFQKDWFESCDEAERQMIGQAAFKSFRTTSGTILTLFLITMILGYMGLVHPLVPLVLGIVWFAQVQSYGNAARKLEYKK